MKIDNYIFDWSGTLSDDRMPVYEANLRMFSDFGLPKLTFKKWLPITTGTVFDYFQQNGVKEKPEKIYSVYRKYYQEVNEEGLLPTVYPEAQNILGNLKKLNKKILVISSHPEEKLLAEAKKFKLANFFDAIIGNVTDKPATIQSEVVKSNFDPQKTIYIGDTVYDIRSAKKAGVISGAIGHGYHSSKILLKEKPDYFFPDLKAILILNNYRQKISYYSR